MTSGHDDFGAAPGGEDDLAMDDEDVAGADEAAGADGPGAWSAGQAAGEADPYGGAIEELGETYGFASDDVLATWAREHAESTGMPPEQFRGLVSGYVEMVADQLKASLEAELGELEIEWGGGARDRLEELTEWAHGLARDEEEFVAVQRLAQTAAGVRFLARLQERGGYSSGGSTAMATRDDEPGFDEQVRALMRSPEYRRGDKLVHAKVRRLYQQRYPGEMVTAATGPGSPQVGQVVPDKRRRGW